MINHLLILRVSIKIPNIQNVGYKRLIISHHYQQQTNQ